MIPTFINFIILILFGIWLSLITFFFFRIVKHYKNLVKGSDGANLKKILEGIMESQKENKGTLNVIEKELGRLEEEGFTHIQKIGLERFNPFEETGGDHSFSLAIMDGKENGFILTGLHGRDRTRVYVKPIKKGKSEYELSSEERKAFSKALKS